jgi:hypothetical protein
MHAARIEKSGRLRRVLELLREKRSEGATTRDIIDVAHVCAVNSIVSELRANGFRIECDFDRRGEDGSAIYRYVLSDDEQGGIFGRTA